MVDRDIPLIFNLSMMTQVDELKSKRIFEMKFVEFLESIGRVANYCSFPRIGLTEVDVRNQDLTKITSWS